MEYRILGKSGLKVSELCLGTMQFGWTADENLSIIILDSAYSAGVNFFDTADIYSRWVQGNPGGVAETIIGKWLKNSRIPRDQIIIATKVRGRTGEGPNDEGLSQKHIMDAVEGSLNRLGCDYIDLYQTHWYDENTPIVETLYALSILIEKGLVRYIGCSNYPAWRLTESIWTARNEGIPGFISLQPHYNLVHREEFEGELKDTCLSYGIGVIPYSPLAGGFLTGKYKKDQEIDSARLRGVRRYFTEKNWSLLEKMELLGRNLGGYSISQLALAWLLTDNTITSPIIGPRSLEQLNDNLGAVGLRLQPEDKISLDELTSWK